jgi:hypothetical protein
MVVVRMGNEAYTSQSVAITFNNQIWQYINQLACTTSMAEPAAPSLLRAHPNPTGDLLRIALPIGARASDLHLFDGTGQELPVKLTGDGLDLSGLSSGLYTIQLRGDRPASVRVLKQ